MPGVVPIHRSKWRRAHPGGGADHPHHQVLCKSLPILPFLLLFACLTKREIFSQSWSAVVRLRTRAGGKGKWTEGGFLLSKYINTLIPIGDQGQNTNEQILLVDHRVAELGSNLRQNSVCSGLKFSSESKLFGGCHPCSRATSATLPVLKML